MHESQLEHDISKFTGGLGVSILTGMWWSKVGKASASAKAVKGVESVEGAVAAEKAVAVESNLTKAKEAGERAGRRREQSQDQSTTSLKARNAAAEEAAQLCPKEFRQMEYMGQVGYESKG